MHGYIVILGDYLGLLTVLTVKKRQHELVNELGISALSNRPSKILIESISVSLFVIH